MPSFTMMYFPSLLHVFKPWLDQYQSAPLSTPGPAQLSVTLEEMSGDDIRDSPGIHHARYQQ